MQSGSAAVERGISGPGLLPKARRNRVACLRVLRQISAKDAHNAQRDGLAFGKDKRNFDPVASCARFFRFFFPPFGVG
jgi:hypothetical protein